MRYLGNKEKLLPFIEKVIDKYNISGTTFADLFSGTCSVGDYFKDRYAILANDFLYYSYIISGAKLKNNKIPEFRRFRKNYDEDVFDWLNNVTPTPNGNYFIYNNYSPKGNRMFFTEENALKIDAIRISIEELYSQELLEDNEYSYLIASLLDSTTKIANTSGTFEAFFKFWEPRSQKEFQIEPIEINLTDKGVSNNKIFNEETNGLVRKIDGDIAYIDPPYTVSQYISAYHMLETIAKYDYPKITGVAGKRERGAKNSMYARKNQAIIEFEDLFRQLKFKHVLVSYSNQGLIPIEELINLASKFAKNNKVYIEYMEYKEYKNHRSSNKRKGKTLNECIIYFEKDLDINKSPLNYSGSKDKLMDKIIEELPANVPVFVDVMGGAFNVGVNITALDLIVYNDYNFRVYEIVKNLLTNPPYQTISNIENMILKFGLDKGNKVSYLHLRDSYNKKPSSEKLFVLHLYAFQNMIRFNNKMEYNVPVGVAGYSDDLKQRIMRFKPKTQKVELLNLDYKNIDYLQYPPNTVFYFDPPYFITNAAYNDGKRGLSNWTANEESKLLSILSLLDENGYKFMLSNVIEHKDKKNHLLIEWVKEKNFIMKDLGISGWRYSKNEVLIKNFER